MGLSSPLKIQIQQQWLWNVNLKNNNTDKIELFLALNGIETVKLNGTEIIKKRSWFGSCHEFKVTDGRQAEIQVKADWKRRGLPKVTLTVDKNIIEPIANTPENSQIDSVATTEPAEIPKWGYVFYGLSILLPIATLGGAIPALFGFLGYTGCRSVLKNNTHPIPIKVLLCSCIVLSSWLATYLILSRMVKT